MFHDNIPENRDTCFVCGRKATTREHVFPKWLQHRFNLWDKLLTLPNRTTVPYRQLVIPACVKCNAEVFGSLEQRVEAGVASDADIWRWVNKIHYALGYKDRFFEWDRKHAGAKIGDVIHSNDPLEMTRHFLHAVSGDFTVDPDPFGSVFRFDLPNGQDFVFAHPIASSSVCISLGTVGYVVFVEDGQAVKRDRLMNEAYQELAGKGRKEDMLYFYAQCIELLARHKLGHNLVMSANGLIKLGPTVVHDVEPPNDERFSAFCSELGLDLINNRPKTVEEARRTIFNALTKQSIPIPIEVREQISSCNDMTTLRRWIDRTTSVESAAELVGS